ncbi:MAG: phytanoyl-CoA dioxygenase family protein [Deltaproteobacteria bacterium]|nr:phytanoyl-CoA dioxygenase family protein [Deltaproteobacteria bacterium]MBW2359691.1 phytanoyl-CoA dioxygenase family protein [Deltaproteobacteria bacterium]
MQTSEKTNESFDAYHERSLPDRLAGEWGELAAKGARGLSPLAIRLPDGRAYSYVPEASTVAIVKGDGAAATVVELDEACWQGLRDSTETPPGLVLSQRARAVSGEVSDFMHWEPALRVLYEELPPYDADAPLIGRDGREIDPTLSFHLDDDPERMADFLRVTGYILVREVLPPDEIDGLLDAAEIVREAAREGDETSWWSQHEDGRTMLTRVLNAGIDPRMRRLPADPRLLRIVALSDFKLEPTDTDAIAVLYKHSRMVFDGKADQPWHRDCGLGGHKFMCPLMNGILYLRPANLDTGELRLLPGSWNTAGCSVVDQSDTLGVGIETNPGDFSLHYGCGMHAGTPPVAEEGPFRMSVVFEYGRPGRRFEQGQEHYDQLMHDVDASDLR